MLRNVLGDYLDQVSEKELVLPFLSLLPALGFFDIHYVHGQVEFGKDVIAKRNDAGGVRQYAFQLKAADITQSKLRNEISGQLLESALVKLSHPNFDENIPGQIVLVSSGILVGNAALELQDIKKRIGKLEKDAKVEFWDREELLKYFIEYGLEAIYSTVPKSYSSFGNFYQMYGKALKEEFATREIERQSRVWLSAELSFENRVLGSSLEAEILGRRFVSEGYIYEAFHCLFGFKRTLLFQLYQNVSDQHNDFLLQTIVETDKRLLEIAEHFFLEFEQKWNASEKNLARMIEGSSVFFSYMVYAARVLEMLGYLFFASGEKVRDQVIKFLEEFIKNEPGAGHPPSDRYAISIILPVIALAESGKTEVALNLVKNAVVWLCDRFVGGLGLAPFDADQLDEVSILQGYAFDFIQNEARGSFLASVASDLSAYLESPEFYSDVVNDIKACEIFPSYWQIPDANDLFDIRGEQIIIYPSVDFDDTFSPFEDYSYAEHIRHEIRKYSVEDKLKPFSFVSTLMLLLRDRYFPTTWKRLVY